MSEFLLNWNEAVTTSLGFFWMALWAFMGWLPDFSSVVAPEEREFFKLNYQMVLNIVFLLLTLVLVMFWLRGQSDDAGCEHHDHDHGGASLTDKVLNILVLVACIWLAGGLLATAL